MPFSYFLRCHSDSGHVIPSVAEESRRPPLTPLEMSRFLGYARNDMGLICGDWGWLVVGDDMGEMIGMEWDGG